MDDDTFKTFAAIIINAIRDIDPKVADVVQEYIDAQVDFKADKVDKELIHSILDKFPKPGECSETLVGLIASIHHLVASYQVTYI